MLITTSTSPILCFFYQQIWLVIVNRLLNWLRNSSVASFRVNLDPARNLHNRLCKLLHFHLNDQVFKMPFSAIVFLLNYKLALRFTVALNFAFQFIESIDHFSLHTSQVFLQVLDQRLNVSLGWCYIVPLFRLLQQCLWLGCLIVVTKMMLVVGRCSGIRW